MKIVTNRCYGGFGLSPKAIKELVMMNASCVQSFTPKHYYGGDNPKFKRDDWEERWNEDKSKYSVDLGDGFFTEEFMGSVILKDEMLYSFDNHKDELRSNTDLIKVVESMGKEANGYCASLQVTEIPDGVDFEIDEYDGFESIHEKHRSW